MTCSALKSIKEVEINARQSKMRATDASESHMDHCYIKRSLVFKVFRALHHIQIAKVMPLEFY